MLNDIEHAFWIKEDKVEISRELYELMINKINYLENEVSRYNIKDENLQDDSALSK